MAELAKKQQRLKTLIAKKQQYFSRFQRMYDSSKRTEEPAQLDYFRIRYETLEESKTAFLEVIDQIQAVEYEINSDYVPCFQSLDAFDELYCHIKIAARRILKNDDSTNMSVNRGIPKLPKLQIPNFSGNIKDWPTYIECFNSLIHHNGNLSDVDRVHYLIGSLSGAALSVCSGVPPTGENYRIIYQTLVDKYSDKRATANYYLDQIINFRQAQTETATSLNAFLEKFDVAVKSLQKLQISELDDYILAYLALSKLNPETQRLFENAHRKTEMPSYTDIVTFVKEQAKICIRSPNKKLNSSLDSKNDKPKQTHSFLVQNNLSRQNKCYVCKNNVHPITECSKFLGMCPLDRYTFIRNNHFCLNCLGSHKVINCQSSFNCRTCKLRHHTLLHFKKSSKTPNKTENDIAGVDSIARASGYNSSNIPGDSQEMNPSNEVASTSNVQSVANYCSVNAKSHNEDSNKMVLLSTLFHRGGFELVKWATNSEKLLEQIPQQYRSSSTVSFDIHFLKVLGLQWQPKDDILSFSLDITEKRCSKRNILSTVARCFDPLGFLSPVTLKAKLLIKQMWILKLDWDESPPDDIVQWWNEFQTSLPLLTNFSIPRHVGAFDNCIASLIGFADACKTSYGAVVYVRIKSPTGVSTSLLYAKTKVSPLKVLSIPRLELLACHLLAKLLSFVEKTYCNVLNIENIIALSDSTVALSWLNSPPLPMDHFQLISPKNWFHVNGKENISDCLSRGLSPSSFIQNHLWLSGPLWLKDDFSCWPINPVKEYFTKLEEKPISMVTLTKEVHAFYLLADRCSSWLKLLHSVVYVLRFLKLLPKHSMFLADDLLKAEMFVLKAIQNVHFSSEIKMLKTSGNPCSSSLKPLRPFLHEGLLRVVTYILDHISFCHYFVRSIGFYPLAML
ncbi:hypothetical protein NQ318_014645 [Aromia moschata]|uniref:Uncharacterized protein n=1 Tax=Aromia moschata TaxID=1265417 RepID=A0AAV8ZAU9_9CUCU|nr:hypothetical protein NQ318_014645 [Aromia moschata]